MLQMFDNSPKILLMENPVIGYVETCGNIRCAWFVAVERQSACRYVDVLCSDVRGRGATPRSRASN